MQSPFQAATHLVFIRKRFVVAEKMGIKGFTVQFSQNPMVVPTKGSVLVFDEILSNVDNCYQAGAFTAPKTGIYSFYLR